jgi:hypothetical protein
MRAPLQNCRFSCCANWHRAHAHAAPSSFEPALIVSRFSRTMTALLRTKRCRHPQLAGSNVLHRLHWFSTTTVLPRPMPLSITRYTTSAWGM